MSVTRLSLEFTDGNGKVAATSIWLPDTLTIAEVGQAANAFRSAILPLTNASLIRAVYPMAWDINEAGSAGGIDDVRRRLICLFTNGERYRSFALPSPGLLPFDAVLPYIGIRLQRSSILLSNVLTNLETIAENIVDEQGLPFGDSFVVAGITRV